MSNYLQTWALANQEQMRRRVEVAVVRAAQYQIARGDTASPQETAWARHILRGPDAISAAANVAVWAVVTDPSVEPLGEGATDAQIQAAVDARLPELIAAAGLS